MEQRYYVIADIHGRHDLLQMALDWIRAQQSSGTIIFLGDYIDRGPENRKVIEELMYSSDNWEYICLMGNHEDMFLEALEGRLHGMPMYDANVIREWVPDFSDLPIDAVRDGIFPHDVLEWMKELKHYHIIGPNIFAHAYWNPDVPEERQNPQMLMWVRMSDSEAFKSETYHLTHGHTPRAHGPIMSINRTNLDTGAVYSGKLTIGIYEKDVRGPVDFKQIIGKSA